MASISLESISVNPRTGALSYPALSGFTLDADKMYRVIEMFLPHCGGNVEMAVKHAVHQQLAAHKGLATLSAPA